MNRERAFSIFSTLDDHNMFFNQALDCTVYFSVLFVCDRMANWKESSDDTTQIWDFEHLACVKIL